MTRQEIIDKLKSGTYNVTFTKVNGEERTIPFTLRTNIIPSATKDDSISQEKVRNVNEAVIVAYAMDKKAWRSFRVENVKKLEEATWYDLLTF